MLYFHISTSRSTCAVPVWLFSVVPWFYFKVCSEDNFWIILRWFQLSLLIVTPLPLFTIPMHSISLQCIYNYNYYYCNYHLLLFLQSSIVEGTLRGPVNLVEGLGLCRHGHCHRKLGDNLRFVLYLSDVCSLISRILRDISSLGGCCATERNPLCPVLTTVYSQLRNLKIFKAVSMSIYCFNCLFCLMFSPIIDS